MIIFIKTWANDIAWLELCLQSINKYGCGCPVVIVCDQVAKPLIQQINTYGAEIFYCPDSENGYINQQIIKLQAYEYTDEERILFVDSDCIFHTPFNEDTFIIDSKPYLFKTRYELVGDARVWKRITEQYCGFPLEYEYMRRNPMMVLRSTLFDISRFYIDLIMQLKQLETRAFSEFNLIGAYIDAYEKDMYTIINTETKPIPTAVAKQFWSWGGLSNEILKEIKGYLA